MTAAELFQSHKVDILYNLDENPNSSPICAGTLITSYLVLTVYSCLSGKNQDGLKVRLSRTRSDLELEDSQLINVEAIHSFPARNIKSSANDNDIAVIALDPDFQFPLDEPLTAINILQHAWNESTELNALSSASSSSCGDFQVQKAKESDCTKDDGNLKSTSLICVQKDKERSCPLPLLGSGLICKVDDVNFLCGALAENNQSSTLAYTEISKYLHWIRLVIDMGSGTGESRDSADDHYNELTATVFSGHEASSPIPYQLSLQRKSKSKNWRHICGAVIIDTKTALTAAHCFEGNYNSNIFRVVAGITELDSNSNSSSSTIQVLPLQQIIVHKLWNGNVFQGNDIAVIHVQGSFVYNENVSNIWISPPVGTNFTDFRGKVSGWGKTSKTSLASNSLQEAEMKILSDSECKEVWPFLKPSMMCSYDNESNICKGDSGGPLVIKNYQFSRNRTQDLLVGIASFSNVDCEKANAPNAFTKVSNFYNWIRQKRAIRCSPTQLQCFNGQCIDMCAVCSGMDECGDGSTEKYCQEMRVPKTVLIKDTPHTLSKPNHTSSKSS